MTFLIALGFCGAVTGLGVYVSWVAIKERKFLVSAQRVNHKALILQSRKFLVGPCVTILVILLTQWILVAVVTGLIFVITPLLTSKQRLRRDERAVVEALATWTEQLRDTLGGSHGLEQAIMATSKHAPSVIAGAVQRLSAQNQYGKLSEALRRFADDIGHPVGDFVAAALITATKHQARDLAQLLGHLAQCAREEGRMRTRIWVGRARTRSAVKIISFTVIGFVIALVVFDRDYLAVYSSLEGQIILSGIMVVFGVALVLLDKFSKIVAPQRFIGRREVTS